MKSKSMEIKKLKKERKRLRKKLGKMAIEKQRWQDRYNELNRYVEMTYQDY